MRVTDSTKVWFPFHLIRNHFNCWNSTALLMSISHSNRFQHCARIWLFYTFVSGVEYHAKGTIKKILLYDLFHRHNAWKSIETSIQYNQINVFNCDCDTWQVVITNIAKMINYIYTYTFQRYMKRGFLKCDLAEMSTNYFSISIMRKMYFM